ncbi:MAG: hypothetical protein Q9207_007065 [Kuettlingeria erythrocarpa]
MISYSVVFLISTTSHFLSLVVAAPALPYLDAGVIQLPPSSSINASAPDQLLQPPDPSVYRLRPDGPLYITIKDFGDQMIYRDAVLCLGLAWTDIKQRIARSDERHGGRVLQSHEWVHGSVRLKTVPNLPAVIDYGLLEDYVTGIRHFATKSGGYWEWRVTFMARVRDDTFRKYGTAEMTIVR